MKRLVVILLIITIMIMSTSCASNATTLMLEARKDGLLEQKEELQTKNDELKQENSQLTENISKQKSDNKEIEDKIQELRNSIDENNAILDKEKEGLGFTVDEFFANNTSYAILSDYESFKEREEGEFEGTEPYFSFDHNSLPEIVFELYDNEKIKCSVYLSVVYYPDTHNVKEINVSYGNYDEKKQGKEKIDEIVEDILRLYIMSIDGPVTYSSKIDEKVEEFLKKREWNNGTTQINVFDFEKFGIVVIDRK